MRGGVAHQGIADEIAGVVLVDGNGEDPFDGRNHARSGTAKHFLKPLTKHRGDAVHLDL